MKKKDNSSLSLSLSVDPGSLFTELGVEPFSRQVAQLTEELRANAPQVVQLPAAMPENLSEREVATLGRIIQGRAQSEITDELLLNSPTLGHYVRNVSEKIRVICFTDMKGSTDNIVRLGDRKALELLHTHDAIIRACLKAHNGSEIKRTGDGFLIAFFVASDAIACAQAVQRSLTKHNQEHPDTPISVRIGLNAGEPLFDEGDLFGAVVNAAARICKQAPPDQIFVSEVVCQLVAGKDFAFTDRGYGQLPGFREPFHLYAVQWENERS